MHQRISRPFSRTLASQPEYSRFLSSPSTTQAQPVPDRPSAETDLENKKSHIRSNFADIPVRTLNPLVPDPLSQSPLLPSFRYEVIQQSSQTLKPTNALTTDQTTQEQSIQVQPKQETVPQAKPENDSPKEGLSFPKMQNTRPQKSFSDTQQHVLPIQRLPSQLNNKYGKEPLLNLKPIDLINPKNEGWNVFLTQSYFKQYLKIEDKDEAKQSSFMILLYQRTKHIFATFGTKFTKKQALLAEKIWKDLEAEYSQVLGGGSISPYDKQHLVEDPKNDVFTPTDDDLQQDPFGQVAPLFEFGKPSPGQIQQGNLGDCYLLAAMSSVAATNPDHFFSHMKDNFDGTVTVRLYEDVNKPKNFVVKKSVVKDKYAKGSLWVKLYEKAYVAAGYTGKLGVQQGPKTYDSISGGDGDVALMHLTGKATGTFVIGHGKKQFTELAKEATDKERLLIEKELRELADKLPKNKKDENLQKEDKNTQQLQERFDVLMKRLKKTQQVIGQVEETLTLNYVSQQRIQKMLESMDVDPGLKKAILQIANNLPGELGTGIYGSDEINLYQAVRQACDAGQAVTINTKQAIEDKENVAELEKGLAGEAKVSGLASAHAYSVLDYKPKVYKLGQTISLRLRNPWGEYVRKYQKDYQGKTKGVAEQGSGDFGDGSFWIDIADVTAFFDTLTYTKA